MFRMCLTGCSGIGKTTLAKELSKLLDLSFVSGSYSDLLPFTKNISHSNMIQQDSKLVFEQDVQLMNARKKVFGAYNNMISDRSYLDSAAYMIQKLAHRIPTCEIEDFVEKCRILTLVQCNKIIYLPYTKEHFLKWDIEDNNKRILNKFYQAEISNIIDWLIESYWECEFIDILEDNPIFRLRDKNNSIEGHTDILVLKSMNFKDRLRISKMFINYYMNY